MNETDALPNVTTVEHLGKTLYLLGTAHVSQASVDEVRHAIETLKPDTVCVELCDSRYTAMTDTERWKKLDIFKVFKEGKSLFLLANLAVGAYQRRLGQELGVQPGAELLAGVDAANAHGIPVVLADRDVHTTLKRTWGNLGWWKKSKLLASIVSSLFDPKEDAKGAEPVDATSIEKLKEKAHLTEMMQEFAHALPEVKEPLIDERDRYLISKVREARGPKVLAVVGAGHVNGMVANVNTPIDRAALEKLPEPGLWSKIWKWVIPFIVVAGVAFGVIVNDKPLDQLILAWVIPTSLLSGIGAALTGGKLVSIGTALLCSPFTTLHPLIGSPMIVGPVEAWARKPTVQDVENINKDVQSVKGFFKNPFTRTLIVAFGAGLGSAIGTWVAIPWVTSIIAS